ncbi:hypothetical protein [uncultured Tolumonas sp.]|uniref:hypothetical protein n=1 Tax=uncultured Tolumonas sp. TaxID=263765 RepID=UPI002A0A6B0D|nr:hypothetical protein [uncultured Tolumonas sp.]
MSNHIYALHPIVEKYFNDPIFKIIKRKINAYSCNISDFSYFPILYEKMEGSEENNDDVQKGEVRYLYYPIYLCAFDDLNQLDKRCIVVQRFFSDSKKERVFLSSLLKIIFIQMKNNTEYYEVCECLRMLINKHASDSLKKHWFSTNGKISQSQFSTFVGLSRNDLAKGKLNVDD